MASLYYQQEAAALYYAVLGKNASSSTYDYFGKALETGSSTPTNLVKSFLAGNDGLARFANKTPAEILTRVYTNIHGSAPSEDELTSLLNSGSTADAIAKMVDSVLHYSGFDPVELAAHSSFETTVGASLYPAASAAASAGTSTALAIYYVIGSTATTSGINYWGDKLANGADIAKVAQVFVNDRTYLTSLNNADFVARLYEKTFHREPSAIESSVFLAKLDEGATRGSIIVDVINQIKGRVPVTDEAAQNNFSQAIHMYSPGQLPELSYQEQVASIYLAVPGRGVDAQALDSWSKQLASGTTFAKLLSSLISSKEFQAKGGALSGSEFVTKVFNDVWGTPPTDKQLANYTAKGDNTSIAQAIINDLRGSTATDDVTVSAQHAFEADIGNSLLYKTAATLNSASSDGNVAGTVNTGSEHVLSNAEIAVLKNVVLNADSATVTNLKFADQLANLTINGNAAATVDLSNNGVNKGVDATVNNANVILNASSGADKIVVTSVAAENTGTGQFNLGAGNDTLQWAGNAAVGSTNIVSNTIKADGGAGSDVLSANFITKNVDFSESGFLQKTDTAIITTNASQFTSFEKIDLAGYIGKATVSKGSTATDHTFDFGVLNGSASTESSRDVDRLQQPETTSDNDGLLSALRDLLVISAPKDTGSQGFVLSGLADGVKVINAAGGSAARLEVTGDATAASKLNFALNSLALTDKFDIVFTANSDADINAGSVSLNAHLTNPKFKMETVNVASGGNGDFGNILSLRDGDNDVTKINVTGDHHLDLTVGSSYSNVTINASDNTAGVNIDSEASGTGNNTFVHSLVEAANKWPIVGLVATSLEDKMNEVLADYGLQESTTVSIIGSQANDIFSVKDNTIVHGGDGSDVFNIVSSKRDTSATIDDFDYAEDTLVDQRSSLAFSGHDDGIKVTNYGEKNSIDNLVSELVKKGMGTGLEALANAAMGIIGLDSNKLSDKVGISSVGDKHFLTIDQNDDRVLDSNDTIVLLQGGSHADLVNNLYYSPVELNGINLAQFQHEPVA